MSISNGTVQYCSWCLVQAQTQSSSEGKKRRKRVSPRGNGALLKECEEVASAPGTPPRSHVAVTLAVQALRDERLHLCSEVLC